VGEGDETTLVEVDEGAVDEAVAVAGEAGGKEQRMAHPQPEQYRTKSERPSRNERSGQQTMPILAGPPKPKPMCRTWKSGTIEMRRTLTVLHGSIQGGTTKYKFLQTRLSKSEKV